MIYPTSRTPAGLRRCPARAAGRRFGLMTLVFVILTGAAPAAASDVKRTAKNLRMTPEALQQARQALREVTDLALQLPTPPAEPMAALASAWARLHPSEAGSQAERLFNALRNHSARAEPGEVLAVQSALAVIIQSLAFADPERAATLLQQWPAAPDSSDGPAAENNTGRPRTAGQFRRQAQGAVAAALAACDAGRASALVQDILREGPAALMEQNGLINILLSTRSESVAPVVQEMLKRYKEQPVTKETMSRHVNLLQSLSWMAPDMVGPSAREMAQRLKAADPDSLSERPMVLRSQETSVQLEGAEVVALNLLRTLRTHPTVAVEILGEFPGLAEKLNQVGGLDAAFRYGSRSSNSGGAVEEDLTPPYQRKSQDDPLSALRNFSPRGMACVTNSKTAEAWRRKIKELAAAESGFDRLVSEGQMLSYNSPELAEEALRLAEDLIEAVESPRTKAERWVRLLMAYSTLDADFDAQRVEKASAAVKQVVEAPADESEERKAPTNDAAERRPPARPGADRNVMLQTQLFSALGRMDFQQAMNRARALPKDRFKVAAILGILQGLDVGIGLYGDYGRPFYR